MYWHEMSGLDWLWGTLMMGFWVVLLGLVVFAAVRLAQRDRGHGSNP